MKRLLLTLIVFSIISFTLAAEGRTISPFQIELPVNASSYYLQSSLNDENPSIIGIANKSTNIFPLIIRSTTDKEIPLVLKANYGSQIGPVHMPPGMFAKIEPENISLITGENTTVNLVVNIAPEAQDGLYRMEVVGIWGPNDFSGTSIDIQVGNGSDHLILPDEISTNLSQDSNVKIVQYESPLKQFITGILLDKIQCNNDLSLVIKSSNETPACVKPETAQKLIERGWAKQI